MQRAVGGRDSGAAGSGPSSSTPYTLPAGGGEITAWQTNATGAARGTPLTLVALRPLGSYLNDVSVTPPAGITDPNPTNNDAPAVLVAASPIAQAAPTIARCVVPGLKGIPWGFARRVLGLLGCTVRKVSKFHSHVATGDVIKSLPGAGPAPRQGRRPRGLIGAQADRKADAREVISFQEAPFAEPH